jgi:hypothetical protein
MENEPKKREYDIEDWERVIKPAKAGARDNCPCCGYPTLYGRGGWGICELCDWEDDGQDDSHANEVWGGPNGKYSLAEARSNFRKYYTMYSPDKTPTRFRNSNNETEKRYKREIMKIFDTIKSETDPKKLSTLWRKVDHNEKLLHQEVFSIVSAWDKQAREKKVE